MPSHHDIWKSTILSLSSVLVPKVTSSGGGGSPDSYQNDGTRPCIGHYASPGDTDPSLLSRDSSRSAAPIRIQNTLVKAFDALAELIALVVPAQRRRILGLYNRSRVLEIHLAFLGSRDAATPSQYEPNFRCEQGCHEGAPTGVRPLS